jgi:hypothetical protein
MSGNSYIKISDDTFMGQFNPEYREAMETALEEYEKFLLKLPIKPMNKLYLFAYWLFRYSGLIKPTVGQ